MKLGENLKKLRKQKKLTQKSFAKKLDIATSQVEAWESGKLLPTPEDLSRISRILKITLAHILNHKERKIEIIKNELYINGEKVSEFDATDIEGLKDYIDYMRAKKGEFPKNPPPDMISHAKKILVIDDEQQICEMLYTYLVPHNYKVFLAFNGQMGLEYFEEIKPDLILLDLKMPDIDGVEVLKIIRNLSNAPNIPIVIITAYPQEISEIHLADLKIEGYIEKPLSLKTVLNTLKCIVGE